jgi:hypothetical protein
MDLRGKTHFIRRYLTFYGELAILETFFVF